MNLPFDAWLIVVGLAIGAGLAWLVLADMRRRDDDLAEGEIHSEAAWIADSLTNRGIAADSEAVEEVLRLHRTYLAGIPDEAAWLPVPAGRDADAPYDPDDEPIVVGRAATPARPIDADRAADAVAGLPDMNGPDDTEPSPLDVALGNTRPPAGPGSTAGDEGKAD